MWTGREREREMQWTNEAMRGKTEKKKVKRKKSLLKNSVNTTFNNFFFLLHMSYSGYAILYLYLAT